MTTIKADPQFLADLLDLLVANIFKPFVIKRHQLLSVNSESFDDLQRNYKNLLDRLISDLSELVGSPEAMLQRFNQESNKVQIALYERYYFITDNLNDSKPTVYDVPSDLPGLFLWFFYHWKV